MKNSLLTGTLTIWKKNLTINFSNVLYASTENLSKRKNLFPLEKRNNES